MQMHIALLYLLLTLFRPRSDGRCPTGLLRSYQRHFLRLPAPRYASLMATASKTRYRCMQCEMTEDKCACEKYCCLCQGQVDVRLCQDGLYYCPPCREACGYKVSE